MKKIIVLFIIVSMLSMCLTACSGANSPDPTPGGSNSLGTQAVCELLDALANQEYYDIKIDITVTTDFAQLCSSYALTRNDVSYSIDRLNVFPSDGSITDLPSHYKTTVSGYAVIENGQVILLDGNSDIELPSYKELKGNFNFDKDNFTNIVVDDNSFEADVISPSQFYGANVDMTDLKVKVEYTESYLEGISIFYSTANATVQTVYVFDK